MVVMRDSSKYEPKPNYQYLHHSAYNEITKQIIRLGVEEEDIFNCNFWRVVRKFIWASNLIS